MYFLFISSGFMFMYIIYRCIFGNKKDIKAFDYKDEEYDFFIDTIKFYKDDKCIETKLYDKEFTTKTNIELNVDFIYDFYVIDYFYNYKNFKFLSNNNFFIFPFYSKEEIKTYVYINQIKSAKIVFENKETEKTKETKEIEKTKENKENKETKEIEKTKETKETEKNKETKETEKTKENKETEKTKENKEIENKLMITEEINKFVGPNYNFYKDIDYKFKSEHFISYLKAENMLKSNKKLKLILYDNFNNEYSNYDDYLTWEPNLQL